MNLRMRSATLRARADRSEEHTSELQSRLHLVCRLLLEKNKINGLQGTVYDAAMTSRYPSDATDNAVHANISADTYDLQRLRLSPASATTTPPCLHRVSH